MYTEYCGISHPDFWDIHIDIYSIWLEKVGIPVAQQLAMSSVLAEVVSCETLADYV